MSIEKVAKLAGVSNSTVSRVINDHPRVAPQTVRAVREAMNQLAYAPSDRRPGPKPHAGQRRDPALAVTFMVFGTSRGNATPAFDELLRGVSAAAAAHEVRLSFTHVGDADAMSDALLAQIERADGLLLHGVVPTSGDRLRGKACVWLMGNRRRPEWGDQVMPDTYEVGSLAARHLLARGHRRLAYLNLDAGHWSFTLAEHAFVTVARAGGAEVVALTQPRAESGEYWPTHTAQAADRLLNRLLDAHPRPTGLLVADDMQCAAIQPLLQRHGVTLGAGHTEIVSVNNEKPYLMGLTPRPSVLDLRFESVGRRGLEQLMWRIAHPDARERIITAIEPTLVTSSP